MSAAMASRSSTERSGLSIICSMGLWVQARMKHVSDEANVCPWCGSEEGEDAEHFMWTCPRFDEARAAVLPEWRQWSQHLPRLLRLAGIPPALVVG
eukprot:8538108-Alexandrium_andersonii.AAC.1